jgi:hypothetical protein
MEYSFRLFQFQDILLSIVVFWVVTPYVLVGGYQRFGRNILHISSALKMEAICSSKILVSMYKYNITIQTTTICVFTAMKTSNLVRISVLSFITEIPRITFIKFLQINLALFTLDLVVRRLMTHFSYKCYIFLILIM